MSFNPSVKYQVEKLDPIVESDNVLSDLEDIDYEIYDENSYVLFNPKLNDHDLISESTSEREYDVLSRSEEGDDAANFASSSKATTNINVLNKINQWYLSNVHTNHLLNDNIASWNFDDTKANSSHYFYGDELFKYFDSDDYKKLNHITSLINSKYLNDRDSQLGRLMGVVRPVVPEKVDTISESTSSVVMVGGENSWGDL